MNIALRASYIALAEQALSAGNLGEAIGYRALLVQAIPSAPRPVLPAMPRRVTASRKRAARIAEARDRAACEVVSEVWS